MDTKPISKFSFLEKKEVDGKSVYTFIGSKEVVDRDGDIVKVDGIDLTNYMKNPVVMPFHNYGELPVGKTVDVQVVDDMLLFSIEFADTEEGKKIKELIDGGYMRAVSIGFIVKEIYDKNGYFGKDFSELEKDYPEWYQKKVNEIAKAKRIFTKTELLEISVVPIPANQDALLVMASKGIDTAYTFTIDEEGNTKLIELEVPEVKNAVRYSEHPKNMKKDETSSWDRNKAVKSLRIWASTDGSGQKDKIIWTKYRKGFGWYDANVIDNFTSYKYPHHWVVDGDFYVVWRGVVAAMVFLDRGDIPAEDRRSLYNHLARHYREDFDREPPPYKEVRRTIEEAIQDYDDEHIEEYIKILTPEELKEFVAIKQKLEEEVKLLKEEMKQMEEEYLKQKSENSSTEETPQSEEKSTPPPSNEEGVEDKGVEQSEDEEVIVVEDFDKEQILNLIKTYLTKGGK